MNAIARLITAMCCLVVMTATAWAAPSGVLDERGGTFDADGQYHRVNPPPETGARRPSDPAQPGDVTRPGPGDPGVPPRAEPRLTQAQQADLVRTFHDYWGDRVQDRWELNYDRESISRDAKVSREEYVKHAQGDAWVQQFVDAELDRGEIDHLGDGVYKVPFQVIANQQTVVEIEDRWQLIDNRWYHLPDDFVNGIIERAKGGDAPEPGGD